MATFQVRDLMINVIDDRLNLKQQGNFLCTIDQPTQLVCGRASPIMQAVQLTDILQQAVGLVSTGGEQGGLPIEAIKATAEELGQQFVAGAIVNNGAFQPGPDCNGTSGIPTPITPVAMKGRHLSAADLPGIKQRLKDTLATVEKMEAEFAPRAGLEAKVVAEHLTQGLKNLG